MKETNFTDRLTGNEVKTINKNPSRWDDKGNLIMSDGKVHASDPNRVVCEFYNMGKNTILFTSQDNPLEKFMLKPGDRRVVVHHYWIAETNDGGPAKILKLFGDEIGKGQTKPSRPEVKKIMVGGK